MRGCRTYLVVVGMGLGCATGSSAQSALSAPTPVLIDRGMTAGAGATVTNAVGRLAAHAEDRLIPLRLFAEKSAVRVGAALTPTPRQLP